MVVGGVTRTYLLHAGGDAKPGRPLVLVLHGLGGSGGAIERRTRGTFDKLADQFGAVVVYPQASGDRPRWGAWRVGAPGAPPPPDDLGFLSALIDTVAGELAIDRKRVFAAGFSNGASMVYRLGCERAELVAAIAPVSGGMFPDIPPVCRQGPPVSVIGMHGTADPIVPLDASMHGVATWVTRDGCPAKPVTSRLPDSDPGDGTQTHVDTSRRVRPEPRWRSTRSTAVGTPGPARTAPPSPSATPATRPATSTRARSSGTSSSGTRSAERPARRESTSHK